MLRPELSNKIRTGPAEENGRDDLSESSRGAILATQRGDGDDDADDDRDDLPIPDEPQNWLPRHLGGRIR
jgi:hypothetical protein